MNKREINQIINNGTAWDHFVGNQTPEEFMSFKPNSSIKEAVEDYAKGHEFFEGLEAESIELVKDALIEEIEETFTDNCPHCKEPIRLDEDREAKCEGCHWRTVILPKGPFAKMMEDGKILFSNTHEEIRPITYIQRPYEEETVIVSVPDLDRSALEALRSKAPGTAHALERFLKNKDKMSFGEKNLLRGLRGDDLNYINKKLKYLRSKQKTIKFLQGQTI